MSLFVRHFLHILCKLILVFLESLVQYIRHLHVSTASEQIKDEEREGGRGERGNYDPSLINMYKTNANSCKG